jgi:hypothetical protein
MLTGTRFPPYLPGEPNLVLPPTLPAYYYMLPPVYYTVLYNRVPSQVGTLSLEFPQDALAASLYFPSNLAGPPSSILPSSQTSRLGWGGESRPDRQPV